MKEVFKVEDIEVCNECGWGVFYGYVIANDKEEVDKEKAICEYCLTKKLRNYVFVESVDDKDYKYFFGFPLEELDIRCKCPKCSWDTSLGYVIARTKKEAEEMVLEGEFKCDFCISEEIKYCYLLKETI